MEPANDKLTEKIIGCVIEVHKVLGPGFVESIYGRALLIELRRQGLTSVVEHEVKVHYKGELVGVHRIDLIVAETVVVEVKTAQELIEEHYSQVRSYLSGDRPSRRPPGQLLWRPRPVPADRAVMTRQTSTFLLLSPHRPIASSPEKVEAWSGFGSAVPCHRITA